MSKLCKNCRYYDWPRVYYPCRCCALAYKVKFKSNDGKKITEVLTEKGESHERCRN